MSIKILQLDKKILSNYTLLFPDYTYSDEFCSFQQLRNNCQTVYIGVYDEIDLLAILPLNISTNKKIFSVYKDYAFPMVLTKKTINWRFVIKLIKKLYKADYCKLYLAGVANEPKSKLANFILKIDKTYNQTNIFDLYQKKTRNEVRKSITYDYNIKVTGVEDVLEFYDLYIENMKRHKTPARDIQYFYELFKSFNNKCKLILAYDTNKLIGGNLVLVNNQYLRLVFNVSKVEYWPKYVNNLLYHQTVLYSIKMNINVIDFGPGLISDHGHNKFKLGFGAKQEFLYEDVSTNIYNYLMDWLKQKFYNLRLKVKKYV